MVFFMKKSNVSKIIERIAVSNHTSIADVRAELQNALDIAFENKRLNCFNRW